MNPTAPNKDALKARVLVKGLAMRKIASASLESRVIDLERLSPPPGPSASPPTVRGMNIPSFPTSREGTCARKSSGSNSSVWTTPRRMEEGVQPLAPM